MCEEQLQRLCRFRKIFPQQGSNYQILSVALFIYILSYNIPQNYHKNYSVYFR
jgi:hypothetical protein